ARGVNGGDRGPARSALEGRDRGRGDRRLEDLLADEAGQQDAEAGDLDHDQRPHVGMESGWAVALAELVLSVPAQAVVSVGGDRADEEGDHREGGDQVDGGAPARELDEDRNQERRERVEKRGAVGNVDVRMRQSFGVGRHLPVLPDSEEKGAQENQTRSEEDGLRIAPELHAGTLIGGIGELWTPVGPKLANSAAIGAVAPSWA